MPIASTVTRWQFSHRPATARWQHLGAMALSALLLMLAFPRPGWSWLAFVALVPAAAAAGRTRALGRLMWTASLVWGLWWVWMLRWMWPVTPASTLIGPYLGLHIGLALLATAVLAQKGRMSLVLALPLAWVSVEAVRSVWPMGGFSWFTLAQSQAAWDAGAAGRLVQTADLLGQSTVSLIVAMVNGALADAMIHPRRRKRILISAATILILALVYGQWRIGQFDQATRLGPTVAVVQTLVPQHNKNAPTVESITENWRELVALHRTAAQREGVDLIVWPETVIPAPLNARGLAQLQRVANDPRYSDAVRNWSSLRHSFGEVVPSLIAESGIPTLVGASHDVGQAHHNSVFLMGLERPGPPPVYHKVHLVPFGEYIPGPDFLKSLVISLGPYDYDYTTTPGDEPKIFTLPGGARLATPICFEDTVAAVCRRMVYADGRKRAHLLVNLTNDGWFSPSSGALAGLAQHRQHTQLASLRCIENRVPMARSVNTGISGMIDSVGRPGPQVAAFAPGVAAATLRIDRRYTLYAIVGGIPITLMVIVTIALTAAACVFGRPMRSR